MKILKGIYYASSGWLTLGALYAMATNGFNTDKFVIVCGYLSGMIWCYMAGREK